jgi:hypothetical protein
MLPPLPALPNVDVVRDRRISEDVERECVPLDIKNVCDAIDAIYRSGAPRPDKPRKGATSRRPAKSGS